MSDEDNDELWPRTLSPSGVYVRTYYCNKCRKNHLDDEGIFEEHRDYARKHLMPTGEEDTGIEVKRRLMLMGAAEREGTE